MSGSIGLCQRSSSDDEAQQPLLEQSEIEFVSGNLPTGLFFY